MEHEKKYRYSEIWKSVQGEGHYTGVTTAWIRLWGCNFTCQGFGQAHMPREQWTDPWNTIKLTDVTSIEELPIVPFACDSGYSWNKRLRHLAHLDTAEDICNKIEDTMKSQYNTSGHFHVNGQDIHMAFTGGEPLMSQHAVIAILAEFAKRRNLPRFITFETNGTQPLKDDFKSFISHLVEHGVEIFWSVSPKLSASGENRDDAIKKDVLTSYAAISKTGQLKFVVDGSDEVWQEVKEAVAEYRQAGVNFPVWIMPVGARVEQQEAIQERICTEAIERGYYFAPRVHCWIYGNRVGT